MFPKFSSARVPRPFNPWLLLAGLWLIGACIDRLWFALDRSVPSWDPADYLTGALNYWQALQTPQWLSGAWWTDLWQLSSKVPPLTYIATVPWFNLLGRGTEQATGVNLAFSVILLISVLGLARSLFRGTGQVNRLGLWAAGLCLLMPGLYRVRLNFLTDYPLVALVALCFACLSAWRNASQPLVDKQVGRSSLRSRPKPLSQELQAWGWAIAFGLAFGCALMVKQTALFFLFVPLLWVTIAAIGQRAWGRLAQLVASGLLSLMVVLPWYSTNWLFVLTAGKRATVDSAIAEGDPSLLSLSAWTYYGRLLPEQLSWPLLLLPVVGLLLYGWRGSFRPVRSRPTSSRSILMSPASNPMTRSPQWGWLLAFLIGAYLLCSANLNKDSRYTLAYLPVLSLVLAWGLTCWPERWGRPLRWGTAVLSLALLGLNLFPIGGLVGDRITQWLSPEARHRAELQANWPHSQVVDTIVQTTPYLQATLGVLPSTPQINQHNLNYYGALANFQVYGRQVGTNPDQVEQDARSLPWFLTKTGDQGSLRSNSRREAQDRMVAIVEQGPDFQPQGQWPLPDGSTLKLFHRKQPEVIVAATLGSPPPQIQLKQVRLPAQAPPGKPVPVTYEWSGSWQQLQPGAVLLTWHRQSDANGDEVNSTAGTTTNQTPGTVQTPESRDRDSSQSSNNAATSQPSTPSAPPQQWLHDRGLGLGRLQPLPSLAAQSNNETTCQVTPDRCTFRLVERLAMLPPADVLPGRYTLAAHYLNRETGEIYPLVVPTIALEIDPDAPAVPAPELDWVTQLRLLSQRLPLGTEAVGPVFEEVGRLNQYDPVQDYLAQAEDTVKYRLQHEPQPRYAYTLTLATALQRDAQGAIAALEQAIELDPKNPFPYAYLAFVHLYQFQPGEANSAIQQALALSPDRFEFLALDGIAALMRGNFVKTWRIAQQLQQMESPF